MKAVLLSIQPKWCELIASGKKTVEVRKNKPKLETPFKVYIYCTQAKKPIWDDISESIVMYEDDLALTNRWGQGKCVQNPCGMMLEGEMFLNGKVIGEFICDKIYDIKPHYDIPIFCNQYEYGWKIGEAEDCLSFDELDFYLGGKRGYGWHISDLKIYNKPKDLNEFYPYCKGECTGCKYLEWVEFYGSDSCMRKRIKRPPQSWCYVEALTDETSRYFRK